jgi:hypothetical protein
VLGGDDRHATSGSATRASRFLTGLVTHALPGFAPGRRSCRPRTAFCSWTGTNSTHSSSPTCPPTWPGSWPTSRSRGTWTPSAGRSPTLAGGPSKLVHSHDRRPNDPPAAQRTMSQRTGSTVVEVAASHSVYLSQPAAVADLIKRAVSAVAAQQ